MIHLYSGSGAQDIILHGESMPGPEWERRRGVAAGLLERRGARQAAELLRSLPFTLHEGTNGFGDEFHVLYLSVPLDRYVELSRMAEEYEARQHFRAIATVVTEIGSFIRFIALEVDEDAGPEPVPRPSLSSTSDVVERALADAERLIATRARPAAWIASIRLCTAISGCSPLKPDYPLRRRRALPTSSNYCANAIRCSARGGRANRIST